jgi:hypothetical protein
VGRNYDGANLFIGEEFDSGVGEDTKKGGGMAFEQASGAFIVLNVTNGSSKASPTAGVFGKLRI